MLETLDEVDWPSRIHAFGTAADVPDLLRRVVAGGSDGQDALAELFVTIWHQGTVYDATAPAVAFLGELAVSGSVSVPDRKRILALVCAIGRGKGYWQVHQQGATKLPHDLAELLVEEEASVTAAHAAVAQLSDELLDLLEIFPLRLQLSVAVLIAVASDLGGSMAPRLRRFADTLPPFGRRGLGALIELRAHGVGIDARELAALDSDLDDYVEQSQEFHVTIDSHFVDVLVERLCDTNGEGA